MNGHVICTKTCDGYTKHHTENSGCNAQCQVSPQASMTLIKGVHETKSEPIMGAFTHVGTEILSPLHHSANPME